MKVVSVPDSLLAKDSETAVVHRPGSPIDGVRVLVTRDIPGNPTCHVMVKLELSEQEDLLNNGSLIVSFKNDGVPDFEVITVHV